MLHKKNLVEFERALRQVIAGIRCENEKLMKAGFSLEEIVDAVISLLEVENRGEGELGHLQSHRKELIVQSTIFLQNGVNMFAFTEKNEDKGWKIPAKVVGTIIPGVFLSEELVDGKLTTIVISVPIDSAKFCIPA